VVAPTARYSPRPPPLAGRELSGYTLLLPADAARHVEQTHGFDGGAQRAPVAADYRSAHRWLAEGQVSAAEKGSLGHDRLRVTWRNGGESFVSVWEIRPGRRNRAVALVSLWIKRDE